MSTKEKLIHLLESSADGFISGNAIAEELGITRSAIWKNIKLLEHDGYKIEAVTNRGYRLAADNDVLSTAAVAGYLADEQNVFNVLVYNSVSSTNTLLKEKASGLPPWTVMIAGNQTAGRGRVGRSFYSPADTGLYLSILLGPGFQLADAGRLTTAAAVAACRAIEEHTQSNPRIKWVNDVFTDTGKVCGILTEASVNFETGVPDWVITGIGFNVYEPDGGFPEEIAAVAGYIAGKRKKDLRSMLAAAFIRHFYDICGNLHSNALHDEYKKRCFMIGQPIYVIKDDIQIPAEALDIDNNFGLKVRYGDGSIETLIAGEVSTRSVH